MSHHVRFARSLEHALAVLVAMPRFEITSEVLHVLATATGCEWATYWQVDSRQHVLRPAAVWCASGLHLEELKRDTSTRILASNEGTAGHVWRNREPVWTTDLVRDMCLPRSLDAKKAGLAGGIWFAVKTDDAIYGVIELLCHQLDPSTDGVLNETEQFGIQLGTLLELAHEHKNRE